MVNGCEGQADIDPLLGEGENVSSVSSWTPLPPFRNTDRAIHGGSMKQSTFFAVTGVIALLFGAFFLIFPGLALQQYGVPTEAHNQMQAR